MATRPTRLQQQACDKRAQAILLIAEAARLDGGTLEKDDLGSIADRLAGVSPAFSPQDLVFRAIEQRVRALGLPGHTAELFTLLEGEITLLDALLMTDDKFKSLAERMEQELGDV
ncbi:MAG: hypothetical protein ACYC61_05865 [Isosphaeraceae bacterium]